MISIELKGVEEARRMYDPSIVKKATKAALDRTAQSGKVEASEEIRKVWNVKKSDLDPRIRLTPARMGDLSAQIIISGKPMSFSYFGARQIMGMAVRSRSGKNIKTGKLTRGMRAAGPVPQGVLVQILKGKETALLRSAFMSKIMKSGHIGVFRRQGRARLPIEEKNVVSIATMANRPEVMDSIVRRIQERWLTEFPHQLDYYLGQTAKGL